MLRLKIRRTNIEDSYPNESSPPEVSLMIDPIG